MKRRKVLAMLMATSLVVSLGACGSTGNTATGDASADASADASGDASGDMMMNTDPVEGQIGSWNGGGTDASTVGGDDYAYDAALYVEDGAIVEDESSTDRISGDFDEASASDITIDDSESGHNGIIIINSDYEINNATITLNTDADGTDTCDFSGVGSAIAAYTSNVTINDSTIETTGVATMPVFADSYVETENGSNITLNNCVLKSNGGTLYADYMNSPDQATMVAPPWILGIMGTSRATNAMGKNTSMDFLDCETSAGAWAVLSTDSGSNMTLNIYNTSLTLNNVDESAIDIQEEGGQISTQDNPYTTNYGSGYGTYAIGDASEVFAGSTINVGTYATIFTGGSATYTAITAGEEYTLNHADGSTGVYTATESKNTVINSDTFGFMIHQGEDSITIEKGTEVNSGYATFLVKSGSSGETLTASVDDSTLSNGGVLIQVIDNDDSTTGGMMDADDPLNTNGGKMNFKSTHAENEGFNLDSAENDGTTQSFTFTNGDYTGNIYNASGSDASTAGALDATTLDVTLGSGATLNAAAASTAAIHVTYDGSVYIKDSLKGLAIEDSSDSTILGYQNTSYTISEYYDQGHVANLVNYNGGNDISITLTDDAVWNVTGTSLITSLTIEDDAQVVIPSGVTLTVNGTEYTDTTLTASDL